MAAFSEKIAFSDDADGRDSFRVISFRGLDLVVRDVDGFFDATELCRSADKTLYNFQRTKTFRTLEAELLARLKLDGDRGVRENVRVVANQVKRCDTFYHPILFLRLAWWCGVRFYVKCVVLVHAFFDRSRERRELFERLCAFADESAEDRFASLKRRVREYLSSADTDPSTTQRRFCDALTYRKVVYADTDLIVNTRRRRTFFNATRLCRNRANNKLEKYAKKESYRELEKQLSRYFEIVIEKNTDVAEDYYGDTHHTYFHPILFVQLAAWIDVDVYVEVARVVLAYGTNNADLRGGCAWTASSSAVAQPVVGDVDGERATTSDVHVNDDDRKSFVATSMDTDADDDYVAAERSAVNVGVDAEDRRANGGVNEERVTSSVDVHETNDVDESTSWDVIVVEPPTPKVIEVDDESSRGSDESSRRSTDESSRSSDESSSSDELEHESTSAEATPTTTTATTATAAAAAQNLPPPGAMCSGIFEMESDCTTEEDDDSSRCRRGGGGGGGAGSSPAPKVYEEFEVEHLRREYENSLARAMADYLDRLENEKEQLTQKFEWEKCRLEEEHKRELDRERSSRYSEARRATQLEAKLKDDEVKLEATLKAQKAKLEAELNKERVRIESELHEKYAEQERALRESIIRDKEELHKKSHTYNLRYTADRAKIDELEKRLSDLTLQNERIRSNLMKRKTGGGGDGGGGGGDEETSTTTAAVQHMNPAALKVHRIERILARDTGVDGVESVLVFRVPVERNPPVYRLYTMRRQMLGLASAMCKKFRRSESVVALWYITDVAKQDYQTCKEGFHHEYPERIETPYNLIISQNVPIAELEQFLARQLDNLFALKADAQFCNDLLHAADERRREALEAAERRVQEEQNEIIRAVYRSLLNDFRKIYALL